MKMWIDFNRDVIRETGNGLPADFIPFLKHFPNEKTRKVKKLSDGFIDEIQHEMKAHRESFDPGKATKD